MQRCLNKRELDLLVDNNWDLTGDDESDDLALLLDQCKSWENELICFSYFLSQTLERKAKVDGDCQLVLRQIFQQPSEMWLTIQQFDAKFIKYLFRNVRDRNITLEDGLIEVQTNLGQHIYE